MPSHGSNQRVVDDETRTRAVEGGGGEITRRTGRKDNDYSALRKREFEWENFMNFDSVD